MKTLKKEIIYTFIIGLCVGITGIMVYTLFSGHPPFLRAAGVNTGAEDVNARYLDGYGTATATGTSKIYISDGSGYLPDGSIDTGAIINGTITNEDISNSAAIAASKISTSTLDADLLDGKHYSDYFNSSCECISATCSGAGCTATATCSSGKFVRSFNCHGSTTDGTCATIWPTTMSTYSSANISWDYVASRIGTNSIGCQEGSTGNAARIVVLCCSPL